MLSNVDLPDPDSPTIATSSPGATRSERSRNSNLPPGTLLVSACNSSSEVNGFLSVHRAQAIDSASKLNRTCHQNKRLARTCYESRPWIPEYKFAFSHLWKWRLDMVGSCDLPVHMLCSILWFSFSLPLANVNASWKLQAKYALAAGEQLMRLLSGEAQLLSVRSKFQIGLRAD